MSTALFRSERQLGVAYVLWLAGWFGLCGLHRIYTGRWVSGLLWLLTGGFCWIGQFIDLFFVHKMVDDHNEGRDVW